MAVNQQPVVSIKREHPYRPAGKSTFYLVTTVTAPKFDERERTERPPLNLSFVVDRSGSMAGSTFDLARQGVKYAIGLLNRRDTVSLVVYDNTIDVLLSQRKANREAREKAIRRLGRIRPRASTALAEGWATGCAQLAPVADEDRQSICRTILLTDGLANVGETDPVVLARDAGELASRGVTTTTFGVGQQFDEVLLAGMADAGRGRYHYIANSAGLVPVFAGELGELLHVTMRDVSFALTLPAGWQARSLNDLPMTTRDRSVSVDLGDISSGDVRTIVWEIEVPPSSQKSIDTIGFSLNWKTPDGAQVYSEDRTELIEARDNPGPADETVQDRIAVLLSARAQAEALVHNRAGRYDQASAALRQARVAMPMSMQGRQQSADLDAFASQVSAPLSQASLKDRHFRTRRAARTQRDYTEKE